MNESIPLIVPYLGDGTLGPPPSHQLTKTLVEWHLGFETEERTCPGCV